MIAYMIGNDYNHKKIKVLGELFTDFQNILMLR